MSRLLSTLKSGAVALEIPLSATQLELLVGYLEQLERWNRHYNLTAIDQIEKMATYHVLDSLAVVPFVSSCRRMLDVGTGAGLPGIVLAIAKPDCDVVLLDSNGKKTRFLTQLVHEIQLTNVTVVQSRVEQYQTDAQFDGIISRAVGSLDALVKNTQHLLMPGGHWYAMKGVYPTSELVHLTQPYQVASLAVPTLVGERHLVIIEG